jgi:hypothetical protein
VAPTRLACEHAQCCDAATRHVEFHQGRTHVTNHCCALHATIEVAAFERAWGLGATSRPLGNACRRGRC